MCAERVGGAAEGMRRETRLARPGGARGPAEGAGEGGERHVGRGGAVRMGGRRGRGRAVRTPDPSEGRGGAGRVEVEALEMRSEIFFWLCCDEVRRRETPRRRVAVGWEEIV